MIVSSHFSDDIDDIIVINLASCWPVKLGSSIYKQYLQTYMKYTNANIEQISINLKDLIPFPSSPPEKRKN